MSHAWEIERRYTPLPVEVRGGASGRRIGGYAAVFEQLSRNLGGFVEVVDRRAFNDSRGRGWPDVMARYNHKDDMLLGTVGAGTLRVDVDPTGLAYEVEPPEARGDVLELVRRGDVRASSFAFRVVGDGGDEWRRNDDGLPERRLLNVQLVDVAPVNTPAYPAATAALRSLASWADADIEEIEQLAAAGEIRKLFVRTDGPPKPSELLDGRDAAAIARMKLEDALASSTAD